MVLLDNYFPQDPRLVKEVRSLSKNGIKVYIIVRMKEGQPPQEEIDEISVRRIKVLSLRSGRLNAILYYSLVRHLAIFHAFKLIREFRPDVIHVNDLPPAISFYLLSRTLRIPMILDLREDWPDLIRLSARKDSRISMFLSNVLSKLLRLEENFLIKRVEGVIVVVEEFGEELVKRGLPRERLAIVHNSLDIEEMDELTIPDLEFLADESLKVVYVGGVGPERGLETVIRALKCLREKLNVKLYIVGDGSSLPSLKRLAEDLGVTSNVTFTGWLPFEEAMAYVKSADICLVPAARSPETENSFPNKLQQYMYFAKPIAAANVRSLRRIIGECECGFLYEPDDPSSLCEQLILNVKKLHSMGRNGRLFLENVLNWKHSSENLIDLYTKIFKRYKEMG
ncbi:MAG: glycosyltransferase family 4 protein [Candidatus Bathyarchaeia archaeon]